MNLHVSFSRKDAERVSIGYCPTCDRRRRFYSWFQDWYGWHSTCTGCGEQWVDGEMCERPFMPRWRKENIQEAKEAIIKLREKNK